jgi:translation initiation factor 1
VAGRRGRGVTTIYDLPLDPAELRELAGRLKKRCGVGGSAKDGVIELQGDHRDVVLEVLRGEGYDAVRAGG